jgi:hypothetical protein
MTKAQRKQTFSMPALRSRCVSVLRLGYASVLSLRFKFCAAQALHFFVALLCRASVSRFCVALALNSLYVSSSKRTSLILGFANNFG